MARDKVYPQSTAISKAEPKDLGVSDARKQTSTFQVVAKGIKTRSDIVSTTGALLEDYAAGRISAQDVAVYCGILDRDLSAKDQDLRAMELGFRIEMTRRKAEELDKP